MRLNQHQRVSWVNCKHVVIGCRASLARLGSTFKLICPGKLLTTNCMECKVAVSNTIMKNPVVTEQVAVDGGILIGFSTHRMLLEQGVAELLGPAFAEGFSLMVGMALSWLSTRELTAWQVAWFLECV